MFQIFPFVSLMVRTTPPAEWNSPSTTSGAPSVVPVSGMTRTPQFCVACSITQAAAHWATVNSARATGQSGSIAYLRCQGDEESIFNCPMSFNEQRSTLSGMFIPRGGNRHMCFSHNSDAAVQCYDSGTWTSLSAKTYLQFVVCSCDETVLTSIYIFFFSSFQYDLWIQKTCFTVA